MPRIVLLPLLAGVLVTFGFMLHAGDPGRAGWWLGFVPFFLWTLAPFGLAGQLARRFRAAPCAVAVVAIASAGLAASSALAYYAGFVAQPDAQSGLLFLFLPLWQLFALAPVAWLARFLDS